LGWLKHFLFFWVRIILDTNLFIAFTANGNAELKLSRNFSVVFTLWVAENNPLMKQRVIWHLVDVGKIKLVVSNKSIFIKTLIEHFDNNFALFEFVSFFVLWLEKDVFVPDGDSSVVDIVLSCRVLTFLQALDLHNWINSFFRWYFEVFSLFNVYMNHVVATLHLADRFLSIL
jgi:hypothetical protein